jgi:hypothetical protein
MRRSRAGRGRRRGGRRGQRMRGGGRRRSRRGRARRRRRGAGRRGRGPRVVVPQPALLVHRAPGRARARAGVWRRPDDGLGRRGGVGVRRAGEQGRERDRGDRAELGCPPGQAGQAAHAVIASCAGGMQASHGTNPIGSCVKSWPRTTQRPVRVARVTGDRPASAAKAGRPPPRRAPRRVRRRGHAPGPRLLGRRKVVRGGLRSRASRRPCRLHRLPARRHQQPGVGTGRTPRRLRQGCGTCDVPTIRWRRRLGLAAARYILSCSEPATGDGRGPSPSAITV